MASNQTFNFDGKSVPMFALESTVQQLAHTMQQIAASTMALGAINAGTKFSGMQNKNLVQIQKGMNKNIHDMHHVGIAGLSKTFLFGTNMITTSLGQKLGELGNLSKGMDKLAIMFKPTAVGQGIFGGLAGFLSKYTVPGFGKLAKIVTKAGRGLNLASLGIAGILGVMEGYRTKLQDLTNYGAGFGTKMLELQTTLSLASVSLDDYILVMQEYGAGVRNLGETSQEAASNFSVLATKVRQTAKEFGAYGLTSQEINQFIGEYLELQRKSGKQGKEAADGVEGAFRSLALQTDAMARQTGRDRREALRAGMGVAGAGGVRRRAEALGGEAGERLTNTSALFGAMIKMTFGEKGEKMMGPITDAIATGAGLELTDMQPMIALMGESGTMLSQITKDISEGRLTEAETAERFEAFSKVFADLKKTRDQRQTELIAQQGQTGLMDVIEAQTAFVQMTDLVKKAQAYVKESDKKDKTIQAITSDTFAKQGQALLSSYEQQMKTIETTVEGFKASAIQPMVESGAELAETVANTATDIQKVMLAPKIDPATGLPRVQSPWERLEKLLKEPLDNISAGIDGVLGLLNLGVGSQERTERFGPGGPAGGGGFIR
jgi:hypothetical protein